MEVILPIKTAAGSQRHIPTIAYAQFLCPSHPLSLHRSPPKSFTQGCAFPPFQAQGAPSAPGSAPSPLDNPQPKWAASLTSSKPLGERGKRPPLTCCSHISLLRGSETDHQQHLCCQPPACLRAEGTGGEEKQLLCSQRCPCCRGWQRQRWLCKRGLLAPVLGGHRLWHSSFPRKGGRGMPQSSF